MIITGSSDEMLYSKSEVSGYLLIIVNKMEDTEPFKIVEITIT